jgi:hypothetical protein
MSLFGIVMSGFCVAAILLILWCLAVEGREYLHKRRLKEDPYEVNLKELAEAIVRRAETAREADRSNRRAVRGRQGL